MEFWTEISAAVLTVKTFSQSVYMYDVKYTMYIVQKCLYMYIHLLNKDKTLTLYMFRPIISYFYNFIHLYILIVPDPKYTKMLTMKGSIGPALGLYLR